MSLLTGDPCEPPCWQGLTPGVSTHEEVNEFIRTSRFVNPQTLHVTALRTGDGQRVGVSISWSTTVGRGGGYIDLAVKGGVLNNMIIYPNYDLTVGSLLETYGPPERVNVGITGSFGHIPAVGVTLFYPTNGFTAYLELPIDDARLGPDSTVLRLWYSQAAPLEQFLELGKGYLGRTPERWLESLREWPGYGQLELP